MRLTLEEIILRQIEFIRSNSVFDKNENENYNKGRLLALEEILNDLPELNQEGFKVKYSRIVVQLGLRFDKGEIKDESELERYSGYNNGIVSILVLIDPKLEFSDEMDKFLLNLNS